MNGEKMRFGAFDRSRGSRWGRAMLVGGLAFLTTMALGLSEARAQGGPEGGERMRQKQGLRARGGGAGVGVGVGVKRMAEALELTPAQRQQINGLHQDMRRDLADEQAQLRQLGGQLRTAWQAPQPEGGRILELRRQMNVVRGEIQARRVQFRLAVYRLLTPEQRSELQRMLAQQARRATARRAARPATP